MSANSRNFWILLTTFALTFAAAQWLGRSRPHAPRMVRSIKVEHNSCQQKKKRKPAPEVHIRKGCSMNLNHQITRTPSIDDFVYADKEPKVINMDVVRKNIGYPTLAQQAGIQGKVIVRVLVDEAGNYRQHKVILRNHPILSDQVEEHISELSFLPAKRDGQPIPYWVNIPFSFRLPR